MLSKLKTQKSKWLGTIIINKDKSNQKESDIYRVSEKGRVEAANSELMSRELSTCDVNCDAS